MDAEMDQPLDMDDLLERLDPDVYLKGTYLDVMPCPLVNGGEDCDLFSVEVVHNGFFCGLRENLQYISDSSAFFDDCSVETWSCLWIDEILSILGYEMDGRLRVYWCYPGKDITDGLVPIDCDAHCVEMIKASRTQKTLVLFIDHTNFLRELRDDVILNGSAALPAVISPRKMQRQCASATGDASSSAVNNLDKGKYPEFVSEVVQSDDSDKDSDFYDSDYNVQEGDDDLFAEYVDTSLNDFNEKEFCDEREDEAALDDEDLNLGNEERHHLKNKFKAFNLEVDMANPTFKAGMKFSGVEELRKALATYTIRNRVPIRKVKNDRIRLNDVCADGCPWMLKASADSREGGFCITAYSELHDCEGV
ncbi:hypothetical protein ACQ4PT_068138 [Festuca glaucescens]